MSVSKAFRLTYELGRDPVHQIGFFLPSQLSINKSWAIRSKIRFFRELMLNWGPKVGNRNTWENEIKTASNDLASPTDFFCLFQQFVEFIIGM